MQDKNQVLSLFIVYFKVKSIDRYQKASFSHIFEKLVKTKKIYLSKG